ncbi:MAG: CPBP family intramembrane glutamic endopeptidase [Janthinobacterium lividum]
MSDEFRPEDYIPQPRTRPALIDPAEERAEPHSSIRQPHLGYMLLLLAVGFVALILVGLAVTAAGVSLHLLPRNPAELTRGFPKTNILIEGLTFGLTLLFAGLVFPRMWHRGFGDTIQWNRHTAARYAAWLAGGGVLLSIVAQLLESRLSLQKKMPIDDFFQHPADVWMVALFGTLIAPVCEEIFFRGFLLRGLAILWDWTVQKVSPSDTNLPDSTIEGTPANFRAGISRNAWIVAGVISSGLFAAMHAKQLGFAWSAVAVLWLVGGVLTTVRVRLNSVAASTVVHAVYNGWIFVIIFFVTDGFRHLDKIGTH